MSNIKLDLKMFKHVKSDGKSTTLQHKQGHTLTLAHNALSKEAQEQLGHLSKANDEADEKLAEGGEVDKKPMDWCRCDNTVGDNPACKMHPHKKPQQPKEPQRKLYANPNEEVSQNDSSPVNMPDFSALQGAGGGSSPGIPMNAAQVAMDSLNPNAQPPSPLADASPVPLADNPDAPAPNEQAPEGFEEAPKAAATKGNKKPKDIPADLQKGAELSPQQSQMGIAGASPSDENLTPEQYKQNMSQTLRDEVQKVAADFGNGHITPKTYADLYADKGILGKLGAIFGLMIGGAGAGLAHQPNLLMEMMNKEIDRDMEAQKTSKGEQLNFFKVAQQQEINDQQIENMVKTGKLTDAEAANMRAERDIKANALARITANIGGFKKLSYMANTLPDGDPKKQKAMNSLAILFQGMDAQNSDVIDRASAGLSALKFGNEGGSSSSGSEQDFANRQMGLPLLGPMGQKMSDREVNRHLANIPGFANADVTEPDKQKLLAHNVLDEKVKDVIDYAKSHKALMNKPEIRAKAAQKAHELTLFYNQSADGLGMTPGRASWLEKQIAEHPDELIPQILGGSNAKLQEIMDSNKSRRDQLLGKYGLKSPAGYNETKPTKELSPLEGKILTNKSTKGQVIYKTGQGWIPYKESK